MGDSDEEYDRRRVRDKFKRERSDYQDRHAGGRRDDWSDRDSGTGTWGGSSTGNRDRMSGGGRSGQRGDYSRDYGSGQRRDRYGSPGDRSDMSPPAKRGRGGRDWDERGNYSQSGNYDYNHPNSAWGSIESALQHSGNNSTSNTTHHQGSGMTQPAMQTFKQFLASQPDTVDDTEAVCKYNEYKTKFRKDQIENFFKAHKDEEWFRSRYHPDEFGNRKEEQQAALKNRLNVFMDLLDKGWIDSVSIDVEKSDQIIRLLDAAVIKLEGGTDFDLLSLDEKTEVEKREPDLSLFSVDVEMPKKDEKEDKEDKEDKDDKEEGEGEGEVEGEGEEKKVSESDEGTEKIKSNENAENAEEGEEESKDETISEEKVEEDPDQGEVKEEEKTEHKEEGEEMEEGEEGEDSSTTEDKPDMKPTSSSADDSTANEAKSEEPKPRPLHKKDSIFLRNIAPNITKAEIEEMCKKYPGFLRVALADPAPDRKFYRRGWVTFEKLGKIREICWQMTTTKLKDCELGAIVNRDLTRRIRSVNGIASHKNVVRTDIRNAAKVIFNLDKQRNLWEDDNSEDKNEASDQIPSYGLKSRNPLLKNIAEYMIEEANAEEEELLGEDAGEIDAEETAVNQSLERDESVIKVLDRLLLYLRIVHSVDYYNHSDYPSEDEMPNRIGIMHARGAPPSSKVTNQEVNEYIKAFEAKIKPFLQPLPVITEEEAQKLGKKDPDVEVENFIQENTQELSKDKWLCPLSGKKFKGPDFVRKHIENKHMDRLNEVRRDCAYFNNYIMDPKRPQLPEHPSNRTSAPQQQNRNENQNTNGNTPSGLPWAYPGPLHLNPYMRNGPPIPFPNPMAAWTGLTRGYPLGPMPMDYGRLAAGANRGRFNPRQKQRTYRDLDAPDDE